MSGPNWRAPAVARLGSLIRPLALARAAAGAASTRSKPRDLPANIRGLARLTWDIAFGALRDFVWVDLRNGMVSLRGLSLGTQALAWIGFALLFATLAALVFNDLWRANFPLFPATRGLPGRGSMVPLALIPATLFLLAMAWSFLLAGALHTHPAIRLGALALYTVTALAWVNRAGFAEEGPFWIALVALAVMILIFAVRWRAQPRPGLEFAALAILVVLTLAVLQADGLQSWRASGIPLMLTKVNFDVLALASGIMPLLFYAGTGVAGFTRQTATWLSRFATERLPAWAPGLLLALLLGSRLRDIGLDVFEAIEPNQIGWGLLPYVGALWTMLLIGLAWWLMRRTAAPSTGSGQVLTVEGVTEAAQGSAMRVILLFSALPLATFVILDVAYALVALGAPFSMLTPGFLVAGLLQTDLSWLVWDILANGLLVGLAFRVARRGRSDLALYLAIIGLLGLKAQLTGPGKPLVILSSGGNWGPLEFWWVLLFTAMTLIWLVRGELTAPRIGLLLSVAVVLALLRQTDFLSNRFSPVFGFAGLMFLAFGVAWDALTIGSFANLSTPGLPRVSRIFLYLGYMLITVAVVHWAQTVHDLTTVARLTGGTAMVGFERFGKPMLYAMFLVALATPLHQAQDGSADRKPEPAV